MKVSAAITPWAMDGDTGLEYDYTISAGDTEKLHTGIMLGIPDVGDAEIILDLTMNGNIDSLEMVFAFDLDVVILGFDNYCSDYFPDECPLTFIDTPLDSGDSSPSAKNA